MRIRMVLMASMVFGCVLSSGAQDISIAELKKYIVAMDSIGKLKNQLTVKLNNLSKGNDKITSNRYNALLPIMIVNDEAKLKEAKATPDEIAYMKKAVAIQAEETMKFQKSYVAIINDYIGDALFSRIRNGLREDKKLKRQYDSLMAKPIRP